MVWKYELYAVIRNNWADGKEFTLADLYEFESELGHLHPGNHNLRAKIRQTLQYLRDDRLVEFLDDRGSYRVRLSFDRATSPSES